MNGWIVIYRKIMDHWIWRTSDARFKRWVYLIFTVQWKDKEVGFNSEIVKLKRGQMVTNVSHLRKDWSTNHDTVYRTLDAFMANGMIEYTKTGNNKAQKIVITVTNYDKYQIPFDPHDDGFGLNNWYNKWDTNEKRINNNISFSLKREQNFFNVFKNSDTTQEYVGTILAIEKAEVMEWVERFMAFIKVSKKPHIDENDFNTHFVSWTKDQYLYQINLSKKSKKNESGFDARRGTDEVNNSEQDYATSF